MKNVTQLKSWLNIEHSTGCPYQCAYCYRHDEGVFELRKPKPLASIGNIIKELENYPFFEPGQTHLSISGTKSDAFLPQTRTRTFQILDYLEDKSYKNPVSIVTKSNLTETDGEKLAQYKKITPFIFVSYSVMPSSIESASNFGRVATMKLLKKKGVKVILYWRPLIRGINTSSRLLKRVLSVGERYADAYVLSGLKITAKIAEYIESKGIQLPNESWDATHKILPDRVKNKILKLYNEANCKKPLFYRSSCAVSYLEGQPDFNAHWINRKKNCSTKCPEDQQKRCKQQSKRKYMEKISPIITNCTIEEKTFYRQKFRLPIEK